MLTHAEFIAAMNHACGGAPDARLSLWTLYNQAGRALFTEHAWNWRNVGPVQVQPVSGRNYVELPADFGNPTSITMVGNTAFRAIQTTLDRIMQMRQSQVGFMGGGSYVSFEGNPPANADGSMALPRMHIFPSPLDGSQPAFFLCYESVWRNASESNAEHLYPNIPDALEAALMYKSRALARNLVRQATTYEEAMYAAEIARMKAEDGRKQINYGPLTGGANDFAERHRVSYVSGVVFSNSNG